MRHSKELQSQMVYVYLSIAIQLAELAELVDALDSGSSVRKNFRVQVPGSAFTHRVHLSKQSRHLNCNVFDLIGHC